MDSDFKTLLDKFYEIHNLGYVKSINNYKNGAGFTLEYYLGEYGADFPIPDYRGIELKAIRSYSYASFDLFNSGPDGKYVYPTQWLSSKYGYPDNDYKNIKIFKGDVKGNCLGKIGLFYKFSLHVDYSKKRITLVVYDWNNVLVNNEIYWDFDTLKEKLERKLSKLALIDVDRVHSSGCYYFYYEKIRFYKLKSFDIFLRLIEEGKVYLTFKTGVYKSGGKKGKFHDHGTAFKIAKPDLELLFDRIY